MLRHDGPGSISAAGEVRRPGLIEGLGGEQRGNGMSLRHTALGEGPTQMPLNGARPVFNCLAVANKGEVHVWILPGRAPPNDPPGWAKERR